jgi:hypothetical protein
LIVRPFSFNIIIDLFGFKSTPFCLFSIYILIFGFLFPPFLTIFFIMIKLCNMKCIISTILMYIILWLKYVYIVVPPLQTSISRPFWSSVFMSNYFSCVGLLAISNCATLMIVLRLTIYVIWLLMVYLQMI